MIWSRVPSLLNLGEQSDFVTFELFSFWRIRCFHLTRFEVCLLFACNNVAIINKWFVIGWTFRVFLSRTFYCHYILRVVLVGSFIICRIIENFEKFWLPFPTHRTLIYTKKKKRFTCSTPHLNDRDKITN